MGWIAVGTAVVGGIIALSEGAKNRDLAESMAGDASDLQREQQAKLDKQKAEYKAMTFKNPFDNMENVYD